MITATLVFIALEAFSTRPTPEVGLLFMTGLTLFMGITAVVCFAVSSVQFSVRGFDEDEEDDENEASKHAEEASGDGR